MSFIRATWTSFRAVWMSFKARVRLKAVQMISFKAIQTNFRAVWTCFSRVDRIQKKWTALKDLSANWIALFIELKINTMIKALGNNVHEKKLCTRKFNR